MLETATRRALLEAVYDEPMVDAPRMVLADALLADGDARGELIQLQLANRPKHARRIKQLLRARCDTWLDELAGVVEYPTFHRGFVNEASVRDPAAFTQPTRAWRTVQRIYIVEECAISSSVLDALTDERFAALRCLHGVPMSAVSDLLARRAFDTLGIAGAPLPTIAPTAHSVRELVVWQHGFERGLRDWSSVFEWAEELPFEIECLSLVRCWSLPADTWPWLSERTWPRRIVFLMWNVHPSRPIGWVFELTRRDSEPVLRATWNGHYANSPIIPFGEWIDRIPVKRVEWSSTVRVRPELADEIDKDLRAYGITPVRVKQPNRSR